MVEIKCRGGFYQPIRGTRKYLLKPAPTKPGARHSTIFDKNQKLCDAVPLQNLFKFHND
ncbi:hypothetical protein [Microseira wollei]|uniref:hypothetical protein n=1 Tax=Microseira wollei TaxID=467598 RepID=UPI001CFD984B|nr:hypothetical protein [Microseira wollei]